MNNSLITVIIPCRNSEKTIGMAIDSIINQTYKNLEILVIDDNSTDNTKNIIESFSMKDSRVKYLKIPFDDPNRYDKSLNRNINAGYSARNFGFKNSHGQYITLQDADDASLLNRIEIQMKLLDKYKADHITLDNFALDKKLLGKKLDLDKYIASNHVKVFQPEELYKLSQKSKGLIAKISPKINSLIPFSFKRKKIINKLFFGSLDSYPYSGNYPLFKKEVLAKIQFRKLQERIWPSFMGRGADRDFNFQVAETTRNSYALNIPLYMWSSLQNEQKKYSNIEDYLFN